MTAAWIRKVSLHLTDPNEAKALDLSDFRFTFNTSQADYQSPNNCRIRVYNLTPSTVAMMRGEFSKVILQAGYDGQFGVLFTGTIKQFRIGKEGNTNTYLDILAADGDTLYNWGYASLSFEAGSTPKLRADAIVQAAGKSVGSLLNSMGHNGISGVIPAARGKSVFGLTRIALTAETGAQGCTWSIQNGKVNILPLKGYLPGEAVVLNAKTGLIGRAEQTNEGVRLKSLINPLLQPGGLIRVDNKSINVTVSADPGAPAMIPYNQWTGVQFLADVTADGLYRLLTVEHEGDTRGPNWYSNLLALAVNPTTGNVVAP